MSNRGRAPYADGRFSEGDKVEVLSTEEGFSNAWATAILVSPCKGGWLVEYSRFVDGDGKQLREKVPLHRLRHIPLFPSAFNPECGMRVEGYFHDCWWPGELVEQHLRKGFRLCFDDGDTTWLVRRNVRPMLRRAPVPFAPIPGLARTQPHVGAASTPPLPKLPIRLGHDINPSRVTAAIEELLEDADWKRLNLVDLQAKLEAALLPSEAPGWITPRRYAMVAALEKVLSRRLKPLKPSRTKHRLLSSSATREAKRLRTYGASKEVLLQTPLLRSNAHAVSGSMFSFVRSNAKQEG
ncbi:hypothetical protein AB1Y20_003157 [Prymnesium parvum]|uniref:Agenet domain-containing protein n=1 Tax=Prymnesium parvum TaxID=97485 RepID=A0AB34J9Z5_PRYPA